MPGYLEIARATAEDFENSQNLSKPVIDNANTRKLIEAGWRSKVSFGGVVIWERPDTGFYVSEDVALYLTERSETSTSGRKPEFPMAMRKRTPCKADSEVDFPDDFDKRKVHRWAD